MSEILIISGCQFDELLAKRAGLLADLSYKDDPQVTVLFLASQIPSDFSPDNPSPYFDEELFRKFMPQEMFEPEVGWLEGERFHKYIKEKFGCRVIIELHDAIGCKACNFSKRSCEDLPEGMLMYHVGISAWNPSKFNKSPFNRQLLLQCAKTIKPLRIFDCGNQDLFILHYGNFTGLVGDVDDEEIVIEIESLRNKTSELTALEVTGNIIETLVTEAKESIKNEKEEN